MKESCKAAFARIHADLEDYYARWYHERPMAILPARRDELRELQRVLYKCIAHMAERFEDYVPRFMPLSDREMRILRMQSEYPFRAGTFRPDYLVSEDGELRLCEITSRFFAHGIFLSYFSERVADLFMEKHPGCARETVYEELLETMRSLNRNKGITVIWITHFMEEAAAADRVLVTSNGQVEADGTPAENVIHLTPEGVYMEDSTCENHDCVEQGEVTLDNRKDRILGNFIICLPNQVTLQLFTPDEIEAMLAGQE